MLQRPKASGKVQLRTVATFTLKMKVISYVAPHCWLTPTRLGGVIPGAYNVNLQSFLLHSGNEYGQQHFPVKL